MAVIHFWSQYPVTSPDAKRRHALAQDSWTKQKWTERPVADAALPRHFACAGKRLPYVRDLVDTAAEAAAPDDILVYSNADIGFASNAAVRIALALQANEAGYSFRRDWPRLNAAPRDDEIRDGAHYCGKDVFFFRKRWWGLFRRDMPDMLIGREGWDAVLCELIEATNPNKPLSVPDICWHERHGDNGYWEAPQHRYTLAGQLYNLKLARKWLVQHGVPPSNHGIP